MNIFVLDKNPKTAAQYHCDKHVVKMILESTQLLSTAIRVHSNNSIDDVYKMAHLNHPCTIWTRKNRSNFLWLCELTEELFNEYTKRYSKQHKSFETFQKCKSYSNIIPEGELTSFAQAMPVQYKSEDPVKAYRSYYLGEKKEFAVWKLGNSPSWFVHK